MNPPVARPVLREQRGKTAAWILWVVSLLLAASGLALLLQNLPRLSFTRVQLPGPFSGVVLGLGYATLGLVIVRHRPRHIIGWLFLLMALPAALALFAEQYALFSVFARSGGPLPGMALMAWLSGWLGYLMFPVGVALPCMLFPDGRLISRRWRAVLWLAILASVAVSLSAATQPGRITVYTTVSPIRLPVTNPLGVEHGTFLSILDNAWLLATVTLFASLSAPFFRYRGATGLERQQIKWFAFGAMLTLLLSPLAFSGPNWVGNLVVSMAILLVPVATALAILRYRLYDIDLIIRRTLVYTILTAILGALYLVTVIGLQELLQRVTGQRSPAAVVASTLLIAALFTPLRRRVQNLIDRRFFRRKYNAEQTLADFARFARDEVELERLAAELLRVTVEAMQPERVTLWLAPIRADFSGVPKLPPGSGPNFRYP
jgi:hypothetical protein